MILNKTFSSTNLLNEFVDKKDISVISIETIRDKRLVDRDYGTPIYGTFETYKLWYKENELKQ